MTSPSVSAPDPDWRPYVVKERFLDIARFATFAEALALVRGKPNRAIYNADKCDGEVVDGEWRFDDGLTEEEREQL